MYIFIGLNVGVSVLPAYHDVVRVVLSVWIFASRDSPPAGGAAMGGLIMVGNLYSVPAAVAFTKHKNISSC